MINNTYSSLRRKTNSILSHSQLLSKYNININSKKNFK